MTYDDAGNVIPLSQRFNAADEDIRWSLAPLSEQTIDERINNYLSNTQKGNDFLLGPTPQILRDIGYINLPMLISQDHFEYFMYDELPEDRKQAVEKYFKGREDSRNKETWEEDLQSHKIGRDGIASLLDDISDPIDEVK